MGGNQIGHYSGDKLGGYSQDLTALSAFSNNYLDLHLSEYWQAKLMTYISYCLMSLGRLSEAIKPRLLALKLQEKQEYWQEAALSARNLADIYLHLGQLELAKNTAQQYINYSEKSSNIFEQLVSKSSLAIVLYRSGQFNEAHRYFQQAEILEQQRDFKYLISRRGHRYCELLLESVNNNLTLEAVVARAEYSLRIDKNLLSISLDYLTIARAYAILNPPSQARDMFQQAIQHIEEAKKANHAPPFYLYRAEFYLTQNQLDPALADLNSAWEIIERCDMKLYQVDYLLIHGRYCLATSDFAAALNHHRRSQTTY